MILLIDNYDSFTWNLWHFLCDLVADQDTRVEVRRNDELTAAEALAMKPEAIVLSPGPCTPGEAGISVDLVREAAGKVPVMGVCLGFQSIGVAFGAEIKRIDPPVHGKLSLVRHDGRGLMAGCPDPLAATRYQSLVLDRASLPECLAVTAETESGLVMAIEHNEHPVHGTLFHPESIATLSGYRIFANFLALAGVVNPNEDRLAELEGRMLDLLGRFPDHVHA